ncbi:GerMN domain-containing protein [Streptomyces sioyaensis]|uniref:GerMN domain-containing protein n=1 Tax=Streptomyces sioyaensis TaxID=67364 RepID=UPI001F36F83A|nr:GerMN domain-containing protein [Streptomyces sioyaensis]
MRIGRAARRGGGWQAPAAVVAAAVVLAGCGVTDAGPAAAGAPARGARTAGGPVVRAYFLTANGTWPVARPAPPGAGPQTALNALLAGPTRAERDRGLRTALPAGPHEVRAQVAPGAVDLYLPWVVSELATTAVSQLVCTAAAAPGIPGHKRPVDVVVRIHESGLSPKGEHPWPVMCDETGAAAPVEAVRAAR